ncbi:MAG: BTAD domain-containing putative transcriptional regulator [Chloroflexota bacterium]
MFGEELVAKARLRPPRLKRQTLSRPRLNHRLAQALDYPLTVVQAGPGYGKSTLLAAFLAGRPESCFWYTVTERDADPLVFFLHIIYAFRQRYPTIGDKALSALQKDHGVVVAWHQAGDLLVNDLFERLPGESFLVLDDYHLVQHLPEINAMAEYFIDGLPRHLHVLLSTRHRPGLKGMAKWRARREVLEITEGDLAFTPEEIEALFRTQYGIALTQAQVEALALETEGWIIALQMIYQGMQTSKAESPDRLLGRSSGSLENVFAYLAQEVLRKLDTETQEFLLRTAVLRRLEPEVCDQLLERSDSRAVLELLEEEGLFTLPQGDGSYRYHHVFHEFLMERVEKDATTWARLHQKAATIFEALDDTEEALYHYFTASDLSQAARLLENMADVLIQHGRLSTLGSWIDRLPRSVLEQHPALFLRRGDVHRLSSQYQDALNCYSRAQECYAAYQDRLGLSKSLQGQALVYLDTVRPLAAEGPLRQALILAGRANREESARLLDLIAENRANQGKLGVAQKLHRAAQRLRGQPEVVDTDLQARFYLRTGRLAEAQELLEKLAREEEKVGPGRAARSHRETLFILSLVHAFQGQGEKALDSAQRGMEVAKHLGSPFTEAVGYMRLGHSWMLQNPEMAEEANRCFLRAVEMAEAFKIPRAKVEPLWGLTRLYGYSGNIAQAERAAADAIAIGQRAGDEWIVALVQATLGASYVMAGSPAQAQRLLAQAASAFSAALDNHAMSIALLWLALMHFKAGEGAAFARYLEQALTKAEAGGYDFLFTSRTLLGPRDPLILAPMLIEARRRGIRAEYASGLLARMGLLEADHHPGYTLRLQTLGAFRAWRGDVEITDKEWRREKARHLFLLLVNGRGRMMQRDQIMDTLWPDLGAQAARRDFKVALNAMNNALEPGRRSGAEAFYVSRQGQCYGFVPGSGYWLDAEEFESLVDRGMRLADRADRRAAEVLQRALALYKGDYLQDCLYEDWASAERERLLALYLRALEKLAQLMAEKGEHQACIQACHRILARDQCWEEAYRLLMQCYSQLGNRAMALRTYERCVEALRQELGIGPMAQTVSLYEDMARSMEV